MCHKLPTTKERILGVKRSDDNITLGQTVGKR